jgi:hypothetical protein
MWGTGVKGHRAVRRSVSPQTTSSRLRLLAHSHHPRRLLPRRSYLVSARNHGVRPFDAIHNALTGNPWLPTIATA